MKIGNYNFSLQKFEYLASRSDETHCFGAVLCVNGKPFADCGNNGQGAPTEIDIHLECRALGEEIETFLATQPKVVPPGHTFELDLDLEYIVDELVQQRLMERQQKKIKALTISNLVFKTAGDSYHWRGWKNQTIALMLEHPQGPAQIRKVIAEELSKGYILVNENIPDELIHQS
jgi:hypothetical protein